MATQIFRFGRSQAIPEATINIVVSVSPTAGGYVEGAGKVAKGIPHTLTAIPNEGYEFYRWVLSGDINKNNPIIITPEEDINIRAQFRVKQTYYNVEVINGTPDAKLIVYGAGKKVKGESFDVSISYEPPYVSANWYLNGELYAQGNEIHVINIQNDMIFTVILVQ